MEWKLPANSNFLINISELFELITPVITLRIFIIFLILIIFTESLANWERGRIAGDWASS